MVRRHDLRLRHQFALLKLLCSRALIELIQLFVNPLQYLEFSLLIVNKRRLHRPLAFPALLVRDGPALLSHHHGRRPFQKLRARLVQIMDHSIDGRHLPLKLSINFQVRLRKRPFGKEHVHLLLREVDLLL